jgi:hypothetical protein
MHAAGAPLDRVLVKKRAQRNIDNDCLFLSVAACRAKQFEAEVEIGIEAVKEADQR